MDWHENYNIGIAIIDEQHRKLCDMITELEKSMEGSDRYVAMGMVIKDLVDYARVHFKDEERLMMKIGYPGIENQKNQHKKLIGQIVKILQDIKCGREIECKELYIFLKKWLVDHILQEDKKFSVFMFG